jgi:hypothetical protein
MAVLAYLALVVAVAAPLCGHQGQPLPVPVARAVEAARNRLCARLSAETRPQVPRQEHPTERHSAAR